MNVKCEYCGHEFSDTELNCPNCGGAVANRNRTRSGQPKTIEELRQWYVDRNLPPENVTRFFIGKDIKERRAFGIYKDSNGDFVVYKNKDNGQRAIRYQGKDEAYAVNELYQKLKSEIANQKANNVSKNKTKTSGKVKKDKSSVIGTLLTIGAVIAFIAVAIVIEVFPIAREIFISLLVGSGVFGGLCILYSILKEKFKWLEVLTKKNAARTAIIVWIISVVLSFGGCHHLEKVEYYKYNDHIYCSYHNHYYSYYDYSYWGDYSKVYDQEIIDELEANGDVYQWEPGDTWNDSFVEFKDSSYFDDNFSSSSSDSDYSWSSSDSWDSGSTDWGSDW